MSRLTPSNPFVEMAEKAIARTVNQETAGEWRAAMEARAQAERQQRAELDVSGRRARAPHDRPLAPAAPSATGRRRARGSSGAARRRARRADEARRERLRAQLIRAGAPSTTPRPAPIPWHLTRRAARVATDGTGREARVAMAQLPADIARRLRDVSTSIRTRARRRRVIAAYVLLCDIGEASKRGGACWRVVASFCRAMLCAMMAPAELVDDEGRERSCDENTWTGYMRALVAGGLVEVLQPGGPRTAAERNVLVGPSGWALSQYRLLWFRADGNKVPSPALRRDPIENVISSLPSSPRSGSEDEVRAAGPPE